MADLVCANCQQPLDLTDKFCRQCGLPTLQQAQTQKQTPAFPPDTQELKRNLETPVTPAPFLRVDETETIPLPEPEPEPASVNPAQPAPAFQLSSTTLIMIGLVVFLLLGGAALLILAFN